MDFNAIASSDTLLSRKPSRRSPYMIVATCIAVLLGVVVKVRSAELPEFGLLYNSDGDQLYISTEIAVATQGIKDLVGSLSNTPVKTFMLCIGTDILNYPTQVANNFGWRVTPADNSIEWVDRVTIGRHYAQVDFDPVRVAGVKAKSMGMYFIPSYRMNDDHFISDPLNYPLTGKFWLNNQDKTIGESPVAGYDYSNLLSFAHKQVRDYRMDIINESINRYSDIMDGYELDFNRVQIFFSPGTAQANAGLITAMVRQVRKKLNQVEAQTGREQYLFVRVPPALDNNTWSGLQVKQWMNEKLVDVIIPSVLQSLAHDVPVQGFMTTAKTNGCQVMPSIYPRTNFGKDFVAEPGVPGYKGPSNSRIAQLALYRGAFSNYRFLGVHNFQFYNMSLPFLRIWEAAAESAVDEDPTSGKDRIFAITPSLHVDYEDNYEYAKQVPYTIPAGSSKEFTLIIGENIEQMRRERPSAVVLRLGLTEATAESLVTLEINGHLFHVGAMGSGYYFLDLAPTHDGPQAYFQKQLGDLRDLQQGTNTIRVTNTASSNSVRITDIQLGVFVASVPSDLEPNTVEREPVHGGVK